MTASIALAELFDGLTVASHDALDWRGASVSGASLDTRQLASGELYLALPGLARPGRARPGQAGHASGSHALAHVAQALQAGARAVASVPGAFAEHADAAALLATHGVPALEIAALADDPVETVSLLGDRCFASPDAGLQLVAVTGTDGKTSVCRFIAEAFAASGEPAGYIGTLGWGRAGQGEQALQATALTTPDALTLRRQLRHLLDAGVRHVAMEASSHGLAQGRLHGLSIDMAVLTNLGRDHLDYHGDEAAYAEAKAALFDWPGLRARIVNADDRLGRALVTRGAGSLTRFWLADSGDEADGVDDGVHQDHADDDASFALHARQVRASVDGLRFVIEERHAAAVQASEVSSRLFGAFNVQNLLACAGVLRRAGLPFERVVAALSDLEPVAGRMQRVPVSDARSPTVIVDFAHTPGALAAAIAAVRAHCPGQLCVVFGCGGDRDPGKRAPMARAAAAADRAIVTDDNPRSEPSASIIAMVMDGFAPGSNARAVPDRAAAIHAAIGEAAPDDVVLIAGKGHERVQVVGEQRLPFSDVEVARRALQVATAHGDALVGAPCA